MLFRSPLCGRLCARTDDLASLLHGEDGVAVVEESRRGQGGEGGEFHGAGV